MPEWLCPACGGGFPSEAMLDDVACPWCEQMLGGPAEEYEMGHWEYVNGYGTGSPESNPPE